MGPFKRFAFFTIARDSAFVALAAATLMVGFSYEPSLAFDIGASFALLFSIGLILRVGLLTEDRLLRSEQWRALHLEERPAGDQGRRWARAELERVLLRFAKSAAGVAVILYGSALTLSVT